MKLKNVVQHDINVIKDKRFTSMFDDKKRNTYYNGSMKFIHRKNDDHGLENIWNLVKLFIAKDLRTIGSKEKKLAFDLILQSKTNKSLRYKVIEAEENKNIILKTEFNDVKYFVQYYVKKTNKKYTIVSLSEVAIYPYIITGPKGYELKYKNKSVYKTLLNKLDSYVKNNYKLHS